MHTVYHAIGRLALIALFCCTVSACGQKGPLYLPGTQPHHASTPGN
ncbi:MAG: lipoprotein [Pseudomonadales bacterium]|nr:lipoprotein [Pseudomonadales bacterium]